MVKIILIRIFGIILFGIILTQKCNDGLLYMSRIPDFKFVPVGGLKNQMSKTFVQSSELYKSKPQDFHMHPNYPSESPTPSK